MQHFALPSKSKQAQGASTHPTFTRNAKREFKDEFCKTNQRLHNLFNPAEHVDYPSPRYAPRHNSFFIPHLYNHTLPALLRSVTECDCWHSPGEAQEFCSSATAGLDCAKHTEKYNRKLKPLSELSPSTQ